MSIKRGVESSRLSQMVYLSSSGYSYTYPVRRTKGRYLTPCNTPRASDSLLEYRRHESKNMSLKKQKKLHFSEALFGSVADPSGTMERLLTNKHRPPYTVLTTTLFVCICIVPPLVLNSNHGGTTLDRELVGSVAMTTLITLVLVSLFSSFSVHAIGIRRGYMRTIAVLAYSLAPITLVMVVLSVINWFLQGSFSVLTFVAHGSFVPGDLSTLVFPHAFRGSLALAFIALAFGLRTVTRGSFSMGAVMAALTVVLLLGSFVISLTIVDLAYPSASSRTIEFFARYFAYPL